MSRAALLPRSLTARLAWLFALMAASLLIVVAVVLGRAVEAHFDELDEHELAAKFAVIATLLARTTSPAALAALPERLDDALAGHHGVTVLLRTADGATLYAGPDAARAGQHAGRHDIVRSQALSLPLPTPLAVEARVALDISHHAEFLAAVRTRLWWGIGAAALVAALLGWLAVHRALAPLRRVTATARALSAERLAERLAEGDAPAEVRELVEAFNGMLHRLEAAFRRLSEFSADLAHELRTPISNLMMQTQVALTRARSADEYRDILHSNLEEFDRLARMIGDMLFLAKAERGLPPGPAATVALEEEARALAEFYEALAEEKAVRLAVSGAATVAGDRLMLRRALSNLLSNALRHSAPGATVHIRIASHGAQARVEVENAGAPIPPEALPRLFQRFHRVEGARQGEGAGLGLAITRSIVEAHGGRVTAESGDGRTVFRLELPRVNAPGGRPAHD